MAYLLTISLIPTVIFWVCYLWILIKAFQDDSMQGILCLLVPFYIFYYAFTRFETSKKGLIIGVWLLSLFAGPLVRYLAPVILGKGQACALMTKLDVEQALGEEVGDPEAGRVMTRLGEAEVCRYKTAKEPQKEIVFALVPNCGSLDPVKERFEGELHRVHEVGDEAFWRGSSLFVREKNSCLLIETRDPRGGLSGQAKLEMNETLAQRAIRNLPR